MFDLESWRSGTLADIKSSRMGLATKALVGLTYNEPDRIWLEKILLNLLGAENDEQIRTLAVTCMGHVARIHRAISPELIEKLNELLTNPLFVGPAEDALDDVKSFVAT